MHPSIKFLWWIAYVAIGLFLLYVVFGLIVDTDAMLVTIVAVSLGVLVAYLVFRFVLWIVRSVINEIFPGTRRRR